MRTVAHELGFRFRLGGRGLPGQPHLVFPAHRLAMFVCDCSHYGHDCQPEDISGPADYFRIQRRLVKRDLSIFQTVLQRRGWRTHVIFNCVTMDRPVLEAALRNALTQ